MIGWRLPRDPAEPAPCSAAVAVPPDLAGASRLPGTLTRGLPLARELAHADPSGPVSWRHLHPHRRQRHPGHPGSLPQGGDGAAFSGNE